MTEHASSAYGLWFLVIANSAVFILFALSFTKPETARDWRSFGAFSAFIIALFVEMYGAPVTIFLLSGWLQSRYPGLNPFSHDAGHLWWTMFDLQGDPHFGILHILSGVFIAFGFILLSASWSVLHGAHKAGNLATSGPYAYVRHPQYVAFIAIMLGFLFQWPTILTLLMFPVLVVMYVRLAAIEEREIRLKFGNLYEDYAAQVPAWIPKIGSAARPHPDGV
jgi:protein-S-isoprenylcysteine O-methyltransferase Ste14